MYRTPDDRRADEAPSGRPAPRRFGPEHLFAAIALVFGTFAAALTPPGYPFDEGNHFLRAYDLSVLRLVPRTSSDGYAASRVPLSVERVLAHAHEIQVGKPLTRDDIRALWGLPLDVRKTGRVVQWFTVPNAPVAYAPQAIGIALARALGGGPMGLFFGARMASLLASILVIAAAIRLTPILKDSLAALALLPGSVGLYTTCSADAVLLASCWLLVALQWRWLLGPRPEGRRAGAILTGLAAVAGLCKFPYALLGLAPIGLPGVRGRRAILATMALAALAAVPGAAWLGVGRRYVPAEVRMPDFSYVAVPGKQMDYLRSKPHEVAWIVADNMAEQSFNLVVHAPAIAAPLYTVHPLMLAMATGLVLLLAAVEGGGPGVPAPASARSRATNLLLFVAILATIFLSMYLWWSPVRGPKVNGVQPRYLLPIAPLVMFAIRGTLSGGPLRDGRALALAGVASAAFLLVNDLRLLRHINAAFAAIDPGPSACLLAVGGGAACLLAWLWSRPERTAAAPAFPGPHRPGIMAAADAEPSNHEDVMD